MTTPGPESDPYAGDRPGWHDQPAVPGWGAGQDWYTGPIYDDTGWHLDLSGVDWQGSNGRDWRAGRRRQQQQQPGSAFPDEDHEQEGNGAGPAPAGYDRPANDWADQRDERTGGRHARPGGTPRGPRLPGRGARFPDGPGGPAWDAPAWDAPAWDDRGGNRPARAPRREEPSGDDPRRRPAPDARRWDDQGRGPARDRAGPDYRGRGPARRTPASDDGEGYGPDGYGPEEWQGRAPAGRGAPRPDRTRPDRTRRPDGLRPGGTRHVGARPAAGYPADARPRGTGPGGPGLADGSGARAGLSGGYPVRPARSGPARPRPAGRRRDGETSSTSIVRSSGVMAVGTLGSRLTGFLRTIAQSYALGLTGVAAAYNLANTLPNVVYNLALGGILTSVIVPLIVNASRRDADRGEGYDQRMFTLITVTLLGLTLIATLAAAPLAHIYSGTKITGNPGTFRLTVIFAYFFIPQIFFYGVSSLISAILNSRGSFAAPMWTPIVNNFVVIAVLGLYVAVAGIGQNQNTISPAEVQLLAVGTTLGIVAQTAALLPALRRVGFRWKPRLDFRRAEVAEIGRMAGWMTAYIAATQVAFLVTTRVAGNATLKGVVDYGYAWLLFQLPYAVIGISVITALLPRMSAHAADRRFGLVRTDFSTGVRMSSAIVVPCSLVLAVLGPRLTEVFLAHGATSPAEANYMGVVFAVFCLGMLPYMIFQLQLRVFYALHDSKTPALIGLVTMTVNIVANLLAPVLLPPADVVAGLGAGFGLANLAGAVLAWRILSRRLHGLDGWLIARSLVRMHAATLPAALLAVLVGLLAPNAYLTVIVGGGLAMLLYLVFARALRIEELTGLTRTVMSRLGL